MIVKIFAPTAGFGGVKYNTAKVDNKRGELMKVVNFGPLQAFGQLKPHDYINYLTALAALNRNVKLPQFHAVISAKGQSYNKESLTGIAESWLKEMGYGDQPSLIVFHKDTSNNHVHVVSVRVDRNGKKINSAYEHVRAQKSIRKILGYEFAMAYRFSTRAQFFMVLESRGYPGKTPDESQLLNRINSFRPDRLRAAEIRSLLLQFRQQPGFQEFLKEKHQIELIFHAADGKKPYGYSIIDHGEKQVFKGSEVLRLGDLLMTAGDSYAGPDEDVPAEKTMEAPAAHIRSISIADDVDDQQIHGMRRRRQRKARTNTR
jgi:hypothetical protein